jgi:acyl carrier protein
LKWDIEKMNSDTKKQVIKILSEQLVVDPEDINEDDSLEQDLHIRATELSEFIENLNSSGFDTSKVNLTEIDTVIDLIYALEGETFSE